MWQLVSLGTTCLTALAGWAWSSCDELKAPDGGGAFYEQVDEIMHETTSDD